MMTETTKDYICYYFGWPRPSFKVGFVRNQKLGHFLGNFTVDLEEIQYITATRWFVEVHAKFILYK